MKAAEKRMSNRDILATVESIFPTPIYISKLDRNLNEKELNFLKNISLNEEKRQSFNTFILNEKQLFLLKNNLQNHIDNFFYNELKYSQKAKPYITQSWLNVINKNQSHHRHDHVNSFLSGVYYVKANRNFDKIQFNKEEYNTISPTVDGYNIYNSNGWWFQINSGDVFIFPSSLNHEVSLKNDDNKRISLAFNIFLKGELGEEKNLAFLKL